jgi:AraC-like DNA-binding protein
VELGFHSHSHFSAAFKKAFGQTPSQFKRSLGHRTVGERGDLLAGAKDLDSAREYVSRTAFAGCRKPPGGMDASATEVA